MMRLSINSLRADELVERSRSTSSSSCTASTTATRNAASDRSRPRYKVNRICERRLSIRSHGLRRV